ncbi:hypothetical protein [Veronia nyctiphanis]|nr:hypothetical protein [Veronia nyctiphanis]
MSASVKVRLGERWCALTVGYVMLAMIKLSDWVLIRRYLIVK